MSKLIAVIGSKGFIGSALCRALKDAGHNVIECDLPSCNMLCPTVIERRIRDAEVVYHLGVMPLGVCKEHRIKCALTNIIGTAHILEAAAGGKARRIIYSSASSVYGNPSQIPVPEGARLNPLTVYGATKCASEHLIRAYTQTTDSRLSHVIFRFTNVYGPGQRVGLIPSVIRSILDKKPIEVRGDGSQTRDFVYIDDVVKVLVQAIDKPLYSTTINLGTGEETSVNDIINLCTQYLHRPAILNYVMYDNDRLAFRADNTLLRSIYGDIEFTPIADGIKRTIESMEGSDV